MKRNPAILISLILLLLIGGGGAVYYCQLRKDALQEFAGVDRFLRQFPASSGWRSLVEGGDVVSVPGPTWLEQFGIHRSGDFTQNYYAYTDPRSEGFMSVIVNHDSRGITEVRVRSEPPDAGGLRRDLLEKFPRLKRVLKVNP